MDATAPIMISLVGSDTGKPINGKFTVKLVLTRREKFLADERRRFIIGSNSANALPDLQLEAYKLGLLFVRIVDAPDWWKQSDGGLNLEDGNVIDELHKLAEAKIVEREEELKKEAAAAMEKLAQNPPKKANPAKGE